jgi:hypothetical protein
MTNSFTGKQVGLSVACALTAALTATTLIGCSPRPAQAVAAINDKVYSITPSSVKAQSGILTGEVTEMKVVERVEEGSGRVETLAKLSGKLVLKNISTDRTVRLLDAKFLYMDSQGHRIKLGDNRTEPSISIASSYGSSERLDPGQDVSRTVDVDFPIEALKAKKLKDIRLEFSYIPSQFKTEKLDFTVSLGGQ